MLTCSGFMRKLSIHHDETVQYGLSLDKSTEVPLNNLLGKQFTFNFSGTIECIYCRRPIKKSFNQGYCFVCFRKLARCDQCIVKPELCHYHLGTCREPQWGENVCMKKHIVYLSVTSGIKVGITQQKNIPTRWFDQGATLALPIYEVHTRLQSGLLETAIKQALNDKTNWRAMLKEDIYNIDLHTFWQEYYQKHHESIDHIIETNEHFKDKQPRAIAQKNPIHKISYPRLQQPLLIQSINVDKTPTFTGTLLAMKGQYLLFDSGVINIRKYAGYQVEINIAQ